MRRVVFLLFGNAKLWYQQQPILCLLACLLALLPRMQIMAMAMGRAGGRVVLSRRRRRRRFRFVAEWGTRENSCLKYMHDWSQGARSWTLSRHGLGQTERHTHTHRGARADACTSAAPQVGICILIYVHFVRSRPRNESYSSSRKKGAYDVGQYHHYYRRVQCTWPPIPGASRERRHRRETETTSRSIFGATFAETIIVP